MLPDGFPASRVEMGKEDKKIACLFSGEQFKYSLGVVLSISGRGQPLMAFSGLESRLRQTQGVRFGMELPPKHSRLFGYMDARSWREALTQTPW